ncbi:MAG: putative toxin-antitoxin system toxin component, PIN family [Anaeromyxobacteraceae bacterium]
MRPWRVVLDTMVWLSAAVNPLGAPGEIVRLARSGAFRIVTSSAIHEEIADVLTRPGNRRLFHPHFDAAEWLDLVEFAAADVIEDTLGPRVSVDPKDDMFCWAAYTGAATHIVSKDPDLRNLKHYRGAQVLEPRAFLEAFRARLA